MKIGFFTDSYLPMPDGVATSVEACALALEEIGHEVFIVAPKYPHYKDKRKDIYRLTSVRVVKELDVRWALQLPEKSLLQILRIDFDIIHGHSGGGIMFLGMQVARAKNIPFIVTYHTFWNHYTHYIFKGKIIHPKMVSVVTKWLGNLCTCLVAPTDLVKDVLISYGIKRPIIVIQSGIDLKIHNKIKPGYIRKKENIAKNIKILLYVGRLAKEKSVDFLFHSFKYIHASDPNTALVLVGYGPQQQQLELLARKLKIEKSVYFFGTVKHIDIPRVYADADIFLFASQTETQGMVILEAFASNLPVVAVSAKAFKDIIIDGKNGYLVKKDPTVFADRVIKLLNNKKLYEAFSKYARGSSEKFSVKATADSLDKLYKSYVYQHKQKQKKRLGAKSILNRLRKVNLKKLIPQELID